MEFPGSPPPHKERPINRKMLKDIEKPISLDLPAPPPVITVTCMSDSDTEESATTKNGTDSSSKNGTGMCYLSPFSMCSRADRIASESNLSSSGYSSGPSRCNSNTRLCPLECGEETGGRRTSPLIHAPEIREMDSETTYSENDDEGFDTETADAIRDRVAVATTAKTMTATAATVDRGKHYRCVQETAELEMAEPLKCATLATTTTKTNNNNNNNRYPSPPSGGGVEYQQHPSLPSITIQPYPSTLHLSTDMLHDKSPVSSRSESPLSDKTVFKFSPMFYGRITDSDSIYDFTSSDCAIKKRTGGKKRERKRRHLGGGGSGGGGGSSTGVFGSLCATTPPADTYGNNVLLLDVPGRNDKKKSRFKPNTRRRSRSQQTIVPSSSSSTDSLNDISK